MSPNAKVRVTDRIRTRLEELGMTARELARATSHSDAWISGLLSGAQGLSLDDLDIVAEQLKLSPSELVRFPDSELREIRPHEMRLLRHYQQWPGEIQERWLRILDYFAALAPDMDSAKLLDLWRDLSIPERRRLRGLLERFAQGTPPPNDEPDGDPQRLAAGSTAPNTKGRARQDRKSNEAQTNAADQSMDDPN